MRAWRSQSSRTETEDAYILLRETQFRSLQSTKKKKKKFAGAWLDKVGREKQTAREDGWGLHTHDSGTATASQQSNQHSLTASPNNQLKAKDVSQKRRRKSRGELWRTSGSDSAAVNSYSGVFLLTGVSSALRLYLSSCPPVDSEHTALQNFTD